MKLVQVEANFVKPNSIFIADQFIIQFYCRLRPICDIIKMNEYNIIRSIMFAY